MPDTPRLHLGGRTFADSDLLVMAIVNRTPDSFYDKGATYAEGAALDAVDRAVAEHADIVDIGGVRAGSGTPGGAAAESRRGAGLGEDVPCPFSPLVHRVGT